MGRAINEIERRGGERNRGRLRKRGAQIAAQRGRGALGGTARPRLDAVGGRGEFGVEANVDRRRDRGRVA